MDINKRGILSFDTDDILYEILSSSKKLESSISGGIYVQGERPDDSGKEDIAINTIALTHGVPQNGVSNVNIHVPDLKLKIKGKEQRKADRERLRTLTNLVIDTLTNAQVKGLTFWVTNELVIKEPSINEHYNNIRISWNIHATK